MAAQTPADLASAVERLSGVDGAKKRHGRGYPQGLTFGGHTTGGVRRTRQGKGRKRRGWGWRARLWRARPGSADLTDAATVLAPERVFSPAAEAG